MVAAAVFAEAAVAAVAAIEVGPGRRAAADVRQPIITRSRIESTRAGRRHVRHRRPGSPSFLCEEAGVIWGYTAGQLTPPFFGGVTSYQGLCRVACTPYQHGAVLYIQPGWFDNNYNLPQINNILLFTDPPGFGLPRFLPHVEYQELFISGETKLGRGCLGPDRPETTGCCHRLWQPYN